MFKNTILIISTLLILFPSLKVAEASDVAVPPGDCLELYKSFEGAIGDYRLAGGGFSLAGLTLLTGGTAPVALIFGSALAGYGGLYLLGASDVEKKFQPKIVGQVASDLERGVVGRGIKKLTKDLRHRTVAADEDDVLIMATMALHAGALCKYPRPDEVKSFIESENRQIDKALEEELTTRSEHEKQRLGIDVDARKLGSLPVRLPYEELLFEVVNPLRIPISS